MCTAHADKLIRRVGEGHTAGAPARHPASRRHGRPSGGRSTSSITDSPEAAPGARLPPRYGEGWAEHFESHARPSLRPGVRILDVGSGRSPALIPERRPERCVYTGLDLSHDELGLAPKGSYDEIIAADVLVTLPELCDRFDLILSWQVLEHVTPLDVALENLRSYLRPGGRMVALLSGGYSAFALINRAIPARLGVWALQRLTGRDPDTVFPAHYDRCHYTALVELLDGWSHAEVIALFRGAVYFRWSRTVQRAYVGYESWAARTGRRNLATHYLLVAER